MLYYQLQTQNLIPTSKTLTQGTPREPITLNIREKPEGWNKKGKLEQ